MAFDVSNGVACLHAVMVFVAAVTLMLRDVTGWRAVGVTEVPDRKRLFELVHRIREVCVRQQAGRRAGWQAGRLML